MNVVAGLDSAALLSHFPPIRYAFAYGSGAVPQAGASFSAASPMLDLVFAVDDTASWHGANLALNADHYAWLASASGARAVAHVQDSRFGARLWYNTLVPVPTARARTMKYGVISSAALAEDLTDWCSLYAAGRLHKPVHVLRGGGDAILGAAAAANHRAALRAALLLLPSKFSARELFRAIAGLSYGGDWRMTFGESPRKVENIVDGAAPAFAALYGPELRSDAFALLVHAPPLETAGVDAVCEQDVSLHARAALGARLPTPVQRAMAAHDWATGGSSMYPAGRGGMGTDAALASSPGDGHAESRALQAAQVEPELRRFWEAQLVPPPPFSSSSAAAAAAAFGPRLLRPSLERIVARSARGQALTGLLTAGPYKSAVYAFAKIKKFVRGVLHK